jgi:NAD(P)-dependent dehydrogenase (short-subunit alcohol dehydrogenase family)
MLSHTMLRCPCDALQDAYTTATRHELVATNIRVTSICPGAPKFTMPCSGEARVQSLGSSWQKPCACNRVQLMMPFISEYARAAPCGALATGGINSLASVLRQGVYPSYQPLLCPHPAPPPPTPT